MALENLVSKEKRRKERTLLGRMGHLPSKRSRNRAQKLRPPAGKFQQYTPLVATIDHVLNQISGCGLLRDPPSYRSERPKRNQNKCCNFHRDVEHDMKDCIQLCDQIKALVREGHLREFVERVLAPARQCVKQGGQVDRPLRQPPPPGAGGGGTGPTGQAGHA